MASGDRFIVTISGTGIWNVNNADTEALLRQTQLDYSYYDFEHADPANQGQQFQAGEPVNFLVIADDVFQGGAANVQTVKDQFDAVFGQYLANYYSTIENQQVIPATVSVVTGIGNNGSPIIQHQPNNTNTNAVGLGQSHFSASANNFAKGLGLSVSALAMLGLLAFAVIKSRD